MEVPREPFWPALAAVGGALALYVTLPCWLTMGPSWVLPALEALLLAGLAITTPHRVPAESARVRRAALALTNATALSPTGAMPVTAWAKLLMLSQALISLLTLVLVAARAVNLLG